MVLVGCFRTALLACSGQKSEKAGEKFAPVVNFVANVVDVGDRKLWRFGHFVRAPSAYSPLRRFFFRHVWPPEGSNFVVSMFQQSKPLPLMRKFIPYRLWFDTPTDDWDSKELTCSFWSC